MKASYFASRAGTLFLAICRSAAIPCSSLGVDAPSRVEDTAGANKMAEAVDCSAGDFSVDWAGFVTVENTITVVNGTTLTVTGASNGSSFVAGANKTSLFQVVGGTLHLSRLTFVDGASDMGGAISAIDSTVTVDSCTFFRNTALYHGGATYLYTASLEAQNTTFIANTAAYSGGAIAAENSSVTLVNRSRLQDNVAIRKGGGVSAESCSSGNNSVGGGVSLLTSALKIFDTIFVDNRATVGGAIGATSSSVIVNTGARSEYAKAHCGENTRLEAASICVVYFSGNRGGCNGGAVFLYASTFEAHNTTFVGNSAMKDGGAVAAEISTLKASGAVFVNNTADNFGGAIVASNDAAVYFANTTTFEQNSANYGGAALLHSAIMFVEGESYFTNNSARESGGANSDRESGGAVYQCRSEIQVTGAVLMEANKAFAGGAMRVFDDSTLRVSGSITFLNNNAVEGAGMWVSQRSYVVVTGSCTFEGNQAENGAGLVLYKATTHFLSGSLAKFSNNTSVAAGGGIASFGGGNVILEGCASFTNNSAQLGGGMSVSGGSNVTIAGGDVIMTGNTASSSGGALYLESPNSAHIAGVNFVGNTAKEIGGAVSTVSAGALVTADADDFPKGTLALTHLTAEVMQRSATFSNCVLAENKADLSGGAVFVSGGFVSFASCNFHHNRAGENLDDFCNR